MNKFSSSLISLQQLLCFHEGHKTTKNEEVQQCYHKSACSVLSFASPLLAMVLGLKCKLVWMVYL